MNKSFQIDGYLAVGFLGIYGLLVALQPKSPMLGALALASVVASGLFSFLGLRSKERYNRFCAVVVFALLILVLFAALFLPVLMA